MARMQTCDFSTEMPTCH